MGDRTTALTCTPARSRVTSLSPSTGTSRATAEPRRRRPGRDALPTRDAADARLGGGGGKPTPSHVWSPPAHKLVGFFFNKPNFSNNLFTENYFRIFQEKPA
jgi:hypothetical protein